MILTRQEEKRNWWLAGGTAVLLLAAALRLWALADLPPGLAQDEVLNADIVSFIRGGAHALFFREGYGHEPLYHYWAVPFQVLLGDNVLSIRLPAVFLGLLLVAGTMRWARRDFGRATALAAGAFLALSWWAIIFSRVGLRPILEPLLLLGFAWFFPRRPWLAGLFLGLSFYSYTGARVMVLWPLLLALYGLWQGWRAGRPGGRDVWEGTASGGQEVAAQAGRDGWEGTASGGQEVAAQAGRDGWEGAASGGREVAANRLAPTGRYGVFVAALIALLVAGLVVLPLGLTLRADPSLQQRVTQLEGPLQALLAGDTGPVLGTTLATLGVFSFTGDPRWTYMLPGVPLFDPLTAVFFFAGLLLALWRLGRLPYALLLAWLLAGLLPSALTPDAPSTVRLVGALPAVYVLAALPLGWLWARRAALPARPGGAAWARLGVPLLIGGLLALNLGRTVQNGFGRWPAALETRLKYQSVLLDMARYLDATPGGALVLADGFYRPITADTLRRNLGADAGGRWVQTGAAVSGALVRPGEGDGRLLVPEYAAPDPALLAAAGIDARPLWRSPGRPSFAVYDLPGAGGLAGAAPLADFGGVISLVGYEFLPPGPDAGLQLITVWRVAGELPADLTAFVHWQDGAGALVSQHDGFDAAPATLRAGDIVVQRHVLPRPSTLPTPSGTLRAGLYELGNGRRLARLDPAGAGQDAVTIPLPDDLAGGAGPEDG